MARNEIDILLSVEDKATKALDLLEKKTKSTEKTFKTSALNINASLELVRKGIAGISKAFEFIEKGAKFEQQKQAFERLAKSAGIAADDVIRSMQDMAGGTISAAEAMAGATKAMVLGLAPDKLPKLMEIARVSARAFGTDVGFMFDSLSLGIGRQSRMLLDNLGIIVDSESAYKKYALVNNIVGRELTDAERKQAFLNAALEAGQSQIDKMGVGALTTAEEIGRMKAKSDDLSNTFSVLFAKVAANTGAFEIMTSVLEELIDIASGVDKIDNMLDKTFSSASEQYDAARKKLVELAEERERYQEALNNPANARGAAEIQNHINGLLEKERQLREEIVSMRSSVPPDEDNGPSGDLTAAEEERQRLLQEQLEERMAAIQEFQESLAQMSDEQLAQEITRLELDLAATERIEKKKTTMQQA